MDLINLILTPMPPLSYYSLIAKVLYKFKHHPSNSIVEVNSNYYYYYYYYYYYFNYFKLVDSLKYDFNRQMLINYLKNIFLIDFNCILN